LAVDRLAGWVWSRPPSCRDRLPAPEILTWTKKRGKRGEGEEATSPPPTGGELTVKTRGAGGGDAVTAQGCASSAPTGDRHEAVDVGPGADRAEVSAGALRAEEVATSRVQPARVERAAALL